VRSEGDVRAALRAWVASKAPDDATGEIEDTTPLLGSGLLTSLHVPELILLIERLRERLVDIESLGRGDFHDIDTIVERFFTPEEQP
jgi:hypothetical protein